LADQPDQHSDRGQITGYLKPASLIKRHSRKSDKHAELGSYSGS
jgi:hypothetical protein